MYEAQKKEEMEWGHYGGSDAVLAHRFPVNVNRDYWVKYNHPIIASDANVVFGTHSHYYIIKFRLYFTHFSNEINYLNIIKTIIL